MTQFLDRDIEPSMPSSEVWGNGNFSRQFETHHIVRFTERDNPDGALLAQQIHGESYVSQGYIYPNGLDEYGRLMPELDRTRGDNVIYFLGHSLDSDWTQSDASVRMSIVPDGGDLEALAAYRYSVEALHPEFKRELEQSFAANPERGVVEVASLSKTDAASSIASFELIREILQQAIRAKTDERWLITFADKAYWPIMANFGPRALRTAGEPVAVDVGDERTSAELRLIPAVIDPCNVVEAVAESILEETNNKSRLCYIRTLAFIADGLREDEIHPTATAILDQIRDGAA